MTAPVYPYTLTNGTVGDANQVMANLNVILNYVNSSVALSGANANITSLTGLTTPLTPAQGGSPFFVGGTSGGTAQAQTVAATVPGNFSLTAGYRVTFIAGFTSLGPVTLSVNSTTATKIANANAGDIVAGQTYQVVYDGTAFQLVGQPLPVFGYPYRNKLRNGSFVIATRGTSFANALGYTYDGWISSYLGAGRITVASGIPVKNVNTRALKVTVTTPNATPAATEFNNFYQLIEGSLLQDTDFGSATARQLTLSGVLTTSIAGTWPIALSNPLGTRSYVLTVTTLAGVVTPFSVTIPGDTGGTWVFGTAAGLDLAFTLGAGSSYVTAANTWANGNYNSVAGATNLMGTNGATYTLEDIQLEVGSAATPFERRLLTVEKALNDRYLQYVAVGLSGYMTAAGQALGAVVPFRTEMRAAITSNITAIVDPSAATPSSNAATYQAVAAFSSTLGVFFQISAAAAGQNFTVGYRVLASAEL